MPLKDRQDTRRTFAQFASDVMTRAEFKDAFTHVKTLIQLAISDLSARIDKRFQELESAEKELAARVDGKLRGLDGYTPIKGKDYVDGYTPVKGKDYFDGQDGVTPVAGVHFQIPKPADEAAIAQRVTSSVFPKIIDAFKKKSLAGAVRDALTTLEGDKRIPVTAIHGLDEHVSGALSKMGSYYGGATVSVLQTGTLKVQSAAALDFKGSGAPTVTIGANGVTHLDFPAATLSGTQEKSTTTPDGIQTTFSFAHTPRVIVWNGAIQTFTDDYTVSSLTITFTASAGIPQTNDKIINIYG